MTKVDKLLEKVHYIDKLRRQIEWDRMKDIDVTIHERMLSETKLEVALLKKEIEESSKDHITCANRCADFAEKYYKSKQKLEKLNDWISKNSGRGAGNCQCQYCWTWRCAIYELKELLNG